MSRLKENLNKFNVNPNSLDTINEIIEHYLHTREYTLANFYYKIGKNIDPDDVRLCYNWIILAYYVNETKNMDKFLTRQMENVNCKHAMNNFPFYTKKITDYCINSNLTTMLNTLSDVAKSKLNLPKRFSPSTPSILFHDGFIYINMRFVEYKITDRNVYIFEDPKGTCETINVFVKIQDKTILEMNILEYNNNYDPIMWDRLYKGVEDVRLLDYKNQIYYSSTKPLSHPLFPKTRIGIQSGKIENNFLETKLMKIENQTECEKNWVMCCQEDQLFYIYKWCPLTICQKDKTVGDVDELKIIKKNTRVPNVFSKLRGSTNGIQINGEFWFVCHLVNHKHIRYYYHVFVVLDLNFNFVRMSSLFTFENKNIEYCLGLQYKDEKFLLGYSINDNSSKFIQINKCDVEDLF